MINPSELTALSVRGGTVTTENVTAPPRADVEPRPQKRRTPRGEVHVFENWCKGCGLCIAFCPQGVLVLGMDNRPKAIYPEKCIGCRWCELHCPDFAIFITTPPEQDEAEEPAQP
jgi:2-oxoglutarate ferredoxin oxidoreductase subunit delta